MIDKNSCTKIGECVKLHGVKGEFVIRLQPGIFFEDIDAEFLHFDIDGGLVPFKVGSMRHKNDEDILVSFFDAERESTVSRMLGCDVFADTKDLDTDGEEEVDMYMLVGWKMKDEKLGEIGEITDFMDITNNPLFVVDHNGEELLVPANDDLITVWDEASQILTVNLPEGLVEE
jgi:16S rRNA processing protein RimM